MCAKATLQTVSHPLNTETFNVPLITDISKLNHDSFGEMISALTGTKVTVLSEKHVRVPTYKELDDSEINQLQTFIAIFLLRPVTMFRERHFIEIKVI